MIPLNPIPPGPSYDGFYGFVVLSVLPWIALIVIRTVGAKNKSATLVADRNRAFICSLFLGISDLAWGNLCVEIPGDYPMALFFPLLSIPFLLMMFGCITRIVISLRHHSSDKLLWLLAITSIAYPIITFSGFCVLMFVYSGLAIFASLAWFFIPTSK